VYSTVPALRGVGPAPSEPPRIGHTEPVSFLFSARPPRRDQELAEANERTRRAFARDINDQRALAFGPLPGRRRGGMWMVWAVIAFLVAGAMGLLPSIGGVHIAVSCTTPAVALSSYSVPVGSTLQWKATGPDGVDYVLAVDAGTVTGDVGVPVTVDAGTAATPRAFRMANCEGAGLGFEAPRTVGQHYVRLFERQGTRYVQVAQVPLAVH
jgi:hypothetical protein